MPRDLLIVGGGIVGASAALFAADRGASVVLLDSPETAGPATPAAAGILDPPHFIRKNIELSEINSFAALGEASYRFYPGFLERIREHGGNGLEWNECGGLRVATNESEFDELRTYAMEMEKFQQPVEILSSRECLEYVPNLVKDVGGGMYLPREARVDPIYLQESLLEAVRGLDSVDLRTVHVDGIAIERENVRVMFEDRVLMGKKVLLAAGAWVGKLIPEACQFPYRIEPRSGEMVRLPLDGPSFKPTLYQDDHRAVFVRADSLIVGATVVEDKPLEQVRSSTRKKFIEECHQILDVDWTENDIRQSWVGHRPWINRKGGPYLGPVNEERTVWVAAGHYRSGILQGPYSAKLVVDGMLETGEEADLTYRQYC